MVELSSADTFAEIPVQVLDRIDVPVNVSEVIRYLGYPAGAAIHRQLQPQLEPWIERALERACPRAVFRALPVTAISANRLELNDRKGQIEFRGAIGTFLAGSRFVAPFIATAGPGIEQLASQLLKDGESLAALIVNAVGAERAEAAETVVANRLRQQADPAGMGLTMPYSPGYRGMELTEQRKLFSVFDSVDVGVELTENCLMRPLKSVSGLIGIAPSAEVQPCGSPCDRCQAEHCAMRR